jgi:hypothetical protein
MKHNIDRKFLLLSVLHLLEIKMLRKFIGQIKTELFSNEFHVYSYCYYTCYNKITHKIQKTHSINFFKNTKTRETFFLILRRKKSGQICQSYDVINIFSKREATIPIRLLKDAEFKKLFGLFFA